MQPDAAMKHPNPATAPARRTAQLPARHKGMALITGLLLLLVVTIIAVSMFRGYGVEEQIAGNTREKQRSLNGAISAEQYAEWWLTSGQAPAATRRAGHRRRFRAGARAGRGSSRAGQQRR